MAVNNYFNLTLDTLAPTGSITRGSAQEYLNSANGQNYTIAFGDASYMKVWTDTKAVGDKADAADLSWVDAATSAAITFEGENVYFGHLLLVDSVGNESEVYNTESLTFDPTAPVVTETKLYDLDGLDDLKYDYTNDNVVGFSVKVSDPGLGQVVALKLSGDIAADQNPEIAVNLAGSNLEYTGTIKISTGDGAKTVNVVAVDVCGNESVAGSASIFLDQTQDEITLVVTGITDGDWIQGKTVTATLTADADVLAGIQGYKIWEKNTQAEPGSFKAWEESNKTVDFELANDGTYEIMAIVRDQAGTEYATKNTVTINVDNKAPIVAIAATTAFNGFFSTVEGYNTIDLAYSVDSEGKAPITSYQITVDGNALDGNRGIGVGDVEAGTLELAAADVSGNDGEHTITITATDKAGNVGTASCSVIRDTAAPTGEIEALSGWYTAAREPQITVHTIADAHSGIKTMVAWFTTSDSDVPPTQAGGIEVASTKVLTKEDIYGTLEQGANKVKIALTDNVGNVVVLTDAGLQYDTVAPEAALALDSTIYNQDSATATVTASDATSGVSRIEITGDVQGAPITSQWNGAEAMEVAIKLSAGDGIKKVKVTVYDTAGNTTISNEVAVEFDETAPSISGNVYVKGTDAANILPAITAVRDFDLGVKAADDANVTSNAVTAATIKVWGDIVGYPGESSAYTTTFAVSAGQSELMIIEGLQYTEGDGEKKIYLKAIDNAGNTTASDAIVRTYDGSAPTIESLIHNHDRISVVHTFRRTAADAVSEDYADEVKVEFTPNENIQKYTVSAHNTKTGERKILEGDPTYNVDGLNSMAKVALTIKGEHYRAALGYTGAEDVDGAHVIIIDIWNMAGTQSEPVVINL
jgi:hypothetical protein